MTEWGDANPRRLRLLACEVDLGNGQLSNGRNGRLTTRETLTLNLLVASPGHPVSRERLFEAFGYRNSSRSRAVDKAIHSLRAKVEEDPGRPDHVITVHGVGYVFQRPAKAQNPSASLRFTAPQTPFMGRDAECSALHRRLDQGPGIVAVLGPGGMGKTRLVLEVLEARTADWIFVDCSSVDTPARLIATTASALDAVAGAAGAEDPVGGTLAERSPSIVVFDNVEQAIEACAHALHRWWTAAPQHTFVATSRVHLPLRDADVLTLAPLSAVDGIALFRARARRPVPDSDAALAQLVTRLDGLPLAIELAAARVGLLSVEEILQQLLDALASKDQDRPERHRSLRACLDASLRLLSSDAARGIEVFSVFRGGATTEAARQLLDELHIPNTLEVLEELLDAHLIVPRAGRLWLPQTARAVIEERGSVDEFEAAFNAHSRWVRRFVELQPAFQTPTRPFRSLLPEVDNARAAFTRAMQRRDVETALAACGLVWHHLAHHGPLSEATALLEQLRPLIHGHPCESDILSKLAMMHRRRGDMVQSCADYELAMSVVGTSNADMDAASAAYLRGNALWGLGWNARDLGDVERGRALTEDARRSFEASAELASVDGRLGIEVRARIRVLELILLHSGRWADAQPQGEHTLALAQRHGDSFLLGRVHGMLGRLYRRLGQPDRAHENLSAAVARHQADEDLLEWAGALRTLGCVAHESGRHVESLAAFQGCIELDQRYGSLHSWCTDLGNVAQVSMALGRLDEAQAALIAAAPLARRSGNQRLLAQVLCMQADLHRIRGHFSLARQRLREALSLMSVRPSDEVVSYGQLTAIHVALDEGKIEEAQAILASLSSSRVLIEHGIMEAKVGCASGRPGEAAEALTQLLSEFQSSHRLAYVWALEELGRCQMEAQRPRLARATLIEAARANAELEQPLQHARCLVALARNAFEFDILHREDVENWLSKAQALIERLGEVHLAADLRRVQDRQGLLPVRQAGGKEGG
ncbi:MAG: tetratricopeptide repeat protein [Myxococcota bacterium]